jgi:hypothetical protein
MNSSKVIKALDARDLVNYTTMHTLKLIIRSNLPEKYNGMFANYGLKTDEGQHFHQWVLSTSFSFRHL